MTPSLEEKAEGERGVVACFLIQSPEEQQKEIERKSGLGRAL
jgi:hypothetical protein